MKTLSSFSSLNLSMSTPKHFILCIFFVLGMVTVGHATAWANPQIQKPIKRLIKAIKYKKDSIALKSFNGQLQGESLIGEEWKTKSPDQQKAFINRLHQFFTLMAFPKLRADLEHLETIIYKEPTIEGKQAQVEAVIVVLHAFVFFSRV